MSESAVPHVPEVIRTYNVTRSLISTTDLPSTTLLTPAINPFISPAGSFGFIVLILATVVGNTVVLSALFLDKRLHTPSFFLIANMAIADLLLGVSVLPFSSILQLLKGRWVFGQAFCSTWLALDVLCCTASIIALMAVSIDRYIGVTRPLNYSSIMTRRRTVCLIILVWAVSILTSVVPLFGLTDRGQKSKESHLPADPFTCKVNKDTFYTIFSSMISFYIPVIILLILYSRVYQEAKKQGKKLEKERRRLYEIDYHIAARQQQQLQPTLSNGSSKKHSECIDEQKADPLPPTPKEFCLESGGATQEIKKGFTDPKNKTDDDTSYSSSHKPKKHRARRLLGKHLYSTIKRSSLPHSFSISGIHHSLSSSDELAIFKRKLHSLKREKKAFRTVGLILGALLICWTPFFVTLPLISILKHNNIIQDENTESIWFKITFWMGYCNSALNPFVYAFSNRSIQRAIRQVLFRRCCCFCFNRRKSTNDEFNSSRRARAHSGSLTTETSQIVPKLNHSLGNDTSRMLSKTSSDREASPPQETTANSGPTVSFAEQDLHDGTQVTSKLLPTTATTQDSTPS